VNCYYLRNHNRVELPQGIFAILQEFRLSGFSSQKLLQENQFERPKFQGKSAKPKRPIPDPALDQSCHQAYHQT